MYKLIFLLVLTLVGCPDGNEEQTSRPPRPHPLTRQTVTFPEGEGPLTFRQPAAIGTWLPGRYEVVQTMTVRNGPALFDSLVILPSSAFGIYRKDTLLQYGTVTYLNSRMRHQPAHFVGVIPRPEGFTALGGNSSITATDTTLSVLMGYRDGPDWYFTRK